eukprot:scaffold141158_cov22-Tisochrysis_lutea.AAC.1
MERGLAPPLLSRLPPHGGREPTTPIRCLLPLGMQDARGLTQTAQTPRLSRRAGHRSHALAHAPRWKLVSLSL